MIKSTVSLLKTSKGYEIRQGNVTLFVFTTRREARQMLRNARAAERTALAYLKGVEATGRTACDSRCTSAVGPLCSCACMGQNHQADHH